MTATAILDRAMLTKRQREFFQLRAAGCSIRELARAYQISPASVRDTLEAADRKIAKAKGARA